ncbi:MAG: hypothetical protein KJZ87_06340 [Thermoguttaceae bacterium]|nr:hypothetical protein [Thermoguttaceae bacterium]
MFQDRRDAGRRLAEKLAKYRGLPNLLVLGLPRGGVPVAFEVAQSLASPLDIFVVRKLGVPGREELAMGAIASGGIVIRNDEVIRGLAISDKVFATAIERERDELDRRERVCRGNRELVNATDRVVILIDDGLATGASMLAALQAVRVHRPARLVVAVPVAAAQTIERIRGLADDIVAVMVARNLGGVGQWYDDFRQTSDAEVRELLLFHEEQRRA